MGVLTVSPDVPTAVYRIRSVDRDPNLYFEWQTDNNVKPVELKTDSDSQKWKITPLQPKPGTYIITNVASNANLSILEYTEDGETKYRVSSGGSQAWTLGPRGDQFIIGVAENEKCVDLAANGWLIVWPRYDGQNQRFALEPVQPAVVAAGTWYIRNRSTNSQLLVYTGNDAYTAPTREWPSGTGTGTTPGPIPADGAVPTTSLPHTWVVKPQDGGYAFINYYHPNKIPRWLTDSGGPVVAFSDNICQLIPVPGTSFYYIALSTSPNARVVMDTNPAKTNDALLSAARMAKDDTRQHWQFYTPS